MSSSLKAPRRGRGTGVFALVLAFLLLALGHPQACSEWSEPPDLPAAQAAEPELRNFDAVNLDWNDASRNRAVPVRLYWPRGVAPDAKVPLVVFSHGIGSSRSGYSYLGAYWSSHGYASLHVQHVGSDGTLWWGNPFSLVSRLRNAANEREAIERVMDVRFALDQVLAGPRGPSIDQDRIVAAGHSYGANTTLLAAGARVVRGDKVVDYHDPRIKAAVLLSSPPFYGESDIAAILKSVQVPTLHITSTEDVIRIPGYYSGAQDRIAVFEATGGARKWLAVFNGGSHSIFTDRPGSGGALLNPKVKAATRELSLAFFHRVFDDRDTEMRQWPDAHRGIVQRYIEPPPTH